MPKQSLDLQRGSSLLEWTPSLSLSLGMLMCREGCVLGCCLCCTVDVQNARPVASKTLLEKCLTTTASRMLVVCRTDV